MKKIFLKFIICCLLFATVSAGAIEIGAQTKRERKAAEKLAEEGLQSFNRKDYKTAIDKYGQAIQLYPNNPKSNVWHFQKATAHNFLKETDETLGELNAALSQGFASPLEIYKIRWSLNFDKKNFDAALEDAQKGLLLAPNDLTFSQAIAQIYLAKNSYNDAIAAFQKVVQIDSNNADAYYFIASAYRNLGDFKNQQSNAAEAVKRNTKFTGESYFLIGDAAQKQKNYNEAIEAYQKSLSAKPETYEIYHNLSDIYRIQNRFAEAVEITKKGLAAFPNNADFYIDLSRYYSLADNSALAVGAGQQAVKLLPNKSISHAGLCRAYYEDKQFQPALESCNTALRLNPNDGEANVYLGFTYLSLDKTDTANEYFAKAVNGLRDYTQKNPEYTDGFYLLGNAYYYANQPKNAIDAYSKSLQLFPQFAKARFNLGLAYFVNGNVTAAREQYNALLKVDKDLAALLKQTLDTKTQKPKSEK